MINPRTVSSLAAAVVIFAVAPAGRGDTPKRSAATDVASLSPSSAPPAPKALSVNARGQAFKSLVSRFREALPKVPKLEDQLKNAPQTLSTRLTIAAPKSPTGAYIGSMNNLNYWISPTQPDGIAALQGSSNYAARVTLVFPTEPGKIYAIDCRVLGRSLDNVFEPNVKLSIGGGASTSTTSDQGHVLWAFEGAASQSTTEVKLEFAQSTIWFWGCDAEKVN